MDDLISRAALLDEFHSLCGPQTGDGWDNMGVRNLIMRQKAVDAAPVVDGRWKTALTDKNEFWANYCSVCNTYLPYGIEWEPNYCPNCGARMDGGSDG